MHPGPSVNNALMRDEREHRVVLNLGGIANITVLPAQRGLPATGFDTGPANCLMDLWAAQHISAPLRRRGGAWADTAPADTRLLGHGCWQTLHLCSRP